MILFVRRKHAIMSLVVLVLVGVGVVIGTRNFQAGEVMSLMPASRGMNPPIFYVKTDQKKVALTFDISWGTKSLKQILPILKEHGVRSTFFLSGPWVKMHPDLAKDIFSEGHEIASHGDEHVNLSQYSREEIEKNIRRAHQDIQSVLGVAARYFRPPNGDYDDVVVSVARELGYETVIWGLDSIDWKNPGEDFIIERIAKKVFPGAIILFHASDSAKQTHLALPAVIKGLRSQGYELLTLSELMGAGEPGRDDPR